MSDNKLNLVVRFTALDGLSGALKNMIGLGRTGKQALGDLHREAKGLKQEMANVTGQMEKSARASVELKDRQKQLATAMEDVNRRIEKQRRILAIDGRTARMQARGEQLKHEGQSGLLWGAALAAPVYELAKSSGEYQALTNKLHILGLGDRAVNELTSYAQAMNIAGSSAKENLRYLLEAQGAFRESGEHSLDEQLRGALTMAPLMAKMQATLRASGHALSEEQERYFLRFIEQAGGTTDPKRASALSDGLFRAIQSSGGNVDPAAYQGFLSRAGTAGMRLSARSMFADFEPLIAELHDSAGVGLQSAYSRVNGMVKNNAAAKEMIRLGLWDRDKVIFNSMGGVKEFKNGQNPLGRGAANTLATDPIEFYRKYVLTAYKARGVQDVQRENMMLFGRTGGQLFNLIDKQLPTILRSRQAYQKTQNLDKAYNQTKDSFFGEGGQLRAAWEDFTVEAGTKGGLLENMTAGLRTATGALRMLTQAAQQHPEAFKWITTAVTWLIGMRLATAGVKLVFGQLLGPVGKLWGLWDKYRALGSIAKMFPRLARGASLLTRLSRGALTAGRNAAIFAGRWAALGARMAMGRLIAASRWFGLLGRRAIAAGRQLLVAGARWALMAGRMVVGKLLGAVRVMAMMGKAALLMGRQFVRAGLMMLANPMVLAIVAVVAAVGLLGYVIYRNWGTIKAGIAKGWAMLKQGWAGLQSWFLGLGSKLASIGGDIVQGLVNGINAAPNAIWNALKKLAMTGIGNFTNLFQIKSPSRLMMAMGGHIATGLGMGIDRHGHHPVRSMTRMASAVAGAGALSLAPIAPASATGRHLAGAAAVASGPIKIEIHIHQQPGEDADALVQRLMPKLRRAFRQDQRASHLSTLEDDF